MSSRPRPALALLAVVATLAACSVKETDHSGGGDTVGAAKPDVTTPAPAANVVTVVAKEYAFEAPASIPAGLTTIRLVNDGKELHHVSLIRLTDGKTMEDLMSALRKPGPLPAWAHEAGGVNPPRPDGGEADVTQRLEPGNYVLTCFVPSPDGTPHMMKGMSRALTVAPSSGAQAPDPVPDVVMTLTDYKFALSKPLTPGKHVIRVENAGQQAHELVLARLAPGKTAGDLAKWIDKMQGPPPGEPIGGVAGMAPGGRAYITVDLAPGDYGFLCFLPDVKDGKPHAAHGMVDQIKI